MPVGLTNRRESIARLGSAAGGRREGSKTGAFAISVLFQPVLRTPTCAPALHGL